MQRFTAHRSSGRISWAMLLALVAICILANSLYAQQPIDSTAVLQTEAPRAIDPVLVKPASELTPEQVQSLQKKLSDWPQFNRFREEDNDLPVDGRHRVVFLGDSITEAWAHRDHNVFFPGRPYVNRGISGQTTGQMLLRFRQDVVVLHPETVVILGGINDIAGNSGESTLQMTEDNLMGMTEIAQANGIRVVLSSVLPAIDFPWRPGLRPAEKVRALNAWMSRYAASHNCVYLDYYTALADDSGGMKPGLSKDNVHPTPAGYAIMAPLAEKAIAEAMSPHFPGSRRQR